MGAMGPCQGVGEWQETEAPLPWIPVFAGTTMGVCGSASAGGVGVGAPFECPQQLLWMARGWGFQGVWWRTMALRMVRSLCMQATRATFLGLPWATSRS